MDPGYKEAITEKVLHPTVRAAATPHIRKGMLQATLFETVQMTDASLKRCGGAAWVVVTTTTHPWTTTTIHKDSARQTKRDLLSQSPLVLHPYRVSAAREGSSTSSSANLACRACMPNTRPWAHTHKGAHAKGRTLSASWAGCRLLRPVLASSRNTGQLCDRSSHNNCT